jgi:hypothetical protein
MADQTNSKYSYTLIDPDNIEVVKATEYLVENVFVLGESTFVWGAPKFFKTFFVLAAPLCVAMGVSFFGRNFIGEGSDAFIGRIKAWQILNKIPALRKNFLVVPRICGRRTWRIAKHLSQWRAAREPKGQGRLGGHSTRGAEAVAGAAIGIEGRRARAVFARGAGSGYEAPG